MSKELNHDPSSSEDEDDDGETPGQVLNFLEQSWVNERMAPTLLKPQTYVVDCMIDQMNQMNNNIENHSQGQDPIMLYLHKLEVMRINYMVCSFVRRRLEKIERHHGHFLSMHDKGRSRFDHRELVFARKFYQITMDHFQQSAFQYMPVNQRHPFDLKDNAIMPGPNKDSYVFVEVLKETEGLIVDEGNEELEADVIDMKVGSQFLIRYKLVEKLIDEGHLKLT